MRTCEISLQLHTENSNFSFLQVAVPFLTRTVATGPTPSSHSAPEKNTCMRIRNSVFRLQDLVQLCFVCFWLLTLLPARILVQSSSLELRSVCVTAFRNLLALEAL